MGEQAESYLRFPRPLCGTEQSETLIQRCLMEYRAKLADVVSVCQSVRERDLAYALLASGDKDGSFLDLCSDVEDRKVGLLFEGRGIQVYAQYGLELSFGHIRMDFAIFGRHRLAVEVDGHDWHSSKEQLAADHRRDRELTAAGWRPIRVTGAEMYQGAQDRADEIFKLLGLEPGVPSPLVSAQIPKAQPAKRAPPAFAMQEEEDAWLRGVAERARKKLGLK